jgi:RNA polymerase sigma factor (sigma-70 family)
MLCVDDLSQILDLASQGDPQAASKLLPLVYDELRRLAAAKLAQEQPGQTLEATALVHEAYVRLVANPGPEPGGETPAEAPPDSRPGFANRRHFFAAAAEAMRRILIENARRKQAVKHGGGRARVDLETAMIAAPEPRVDLLALDEALTRLQKTDAAVAELVSLRCFSGLTIAETAEVLGISPRTADAWWAYARAWLKTELGDSFG